MNASQELWEAYGEKYVYLSIHHYWESFNVDI